VQLAGQADQLALLARQSASAREQLAVGAHPLQVATRVAIAVLDQPRQPEDRFRL
jgi:hypothetical protein